MSPLLWMISNTVTIYIRLASTVLLTLTMLSIPGHCYSQNNSYELSEQARTELTTIQDLMQRNELEQALAALEKLRNAVRNRKYDLAVTYQTLGYVYSTLNRYAEASQAFINAIQSDALPAPITHEIQYTVAQLLISEAKYSDGMKYLTAWFRNEKNPPAEAHYLAATAYYFMGDFKQLIYQGRNALSKRQDAPASWHEILLAGYYETNDMNAAAELMETMLKKFPQNTQYWMQLASIYLSLRKTEQALALMELAYIRGSLNRHEDLLQLAQTYLYMEMPYKAATLLSNEMARNNVKKTKETVKLLADSWFLARETDKGISVLADAITTIKDTELFFRLGQLYVESEDWDNAIKILTETTRQKDFKDIADAYLLLGIAALNGKDLQTSYVALNNALKYETTREQATQWMEELRN